MAGRPALDTPPAQKEGSPLLDAVRTRKEQMSNALVDGLMHAFTAEGETRPLFLMAGWSDSCNQLPAQQVLSMIISPAEDFGEAGARTIAEQCRGLVSLSIGDDNGIGEGGARVIAENCTALASLTVGDDNGIGEEGAVAIAQNCRSLTSLSIGKYNGIGEGGCRAIVEHCTGLVSLNVAGLKVSSTMGDVVDYCRGVSVLTLGARKLKEVVLPRSALPLYFPLSLLYAPLQAPSELQAPLQASSIPPSKPPPYPPPSPLHAPLQTPSISASKPSPSNPQSPPPCPPPSPLCAPPVTPSIPPSKPLHAPRPVPVGTGSAEVGNPALLPVQLCARGWETLSLALPPAGVHRKGDSVPLPCSSTPPRPRPHPLFLSTPQACSGKAQRSRGPSHAS